MRRNCCLSEIIALLFAFRFIKSRVEFDAAAKPARQRLSMTEAEVEVKHTLKLCYYSYSALTCLVISVYNDNEDWT